MSVTPEMAKAAARECAAQMGEPLLDDVWTDDDVSDWQHIIAAALAARAPAEPVATLAKRGGGWSVFADDETPAFLALPDGHHPLYTSPPRLPR